MNLRFKALELLTRPLILGPVAAALGAGAVVCVLGIPKLWSPEAAGWASALGSFLAAAVAVGVAFVPRHIDGKRERFAVVFAARKFLPQLENIKIAVGNANAIRHAVIDEGGVDLLVPTGFGNSQTLNMVVPHIPVAPEFANLHSAVSNVTDAVETWNRIASLLPNRGNYEQLQNARPVSDLLVQQGRVIDLAIAEFNRVLGADYPELAEG